MEAALVRAMALIIAGTLLLPLTSALPVVGSTVHTPNIAAHVTMGVTLPNQKCVYVVADPPGFIIKDCPTPPEDAARSAAPMFAAYACVAVFAEGWPIYSGCPSVAV